MSIGDMDRIERLSRLPSALPVLYLPPVQWLAFHRAIAKGLDPDNPTNLAQVDELSR